MHSSSRLIVDASVHDEFVSKLIAKLESTTVGHALGEGVDIGPVASEVQLNENLNGLKEARVKARLVFGGNRIDAPTDGYYMEPTLFINTTNDMSINREELFAPIACVIKADNYEDALSILNDTEFGLTAGIITQSLKTASDFTTSGCRLCHGEPSYRRHGLPRALRGRKNSSFGPREQGQYAREFYTTVKTSYVQA